jgi:protein-serine/threonine kinase
VFRLICDAEHRLGRNNVDEIKSHKFFKKIDWHTIRNMKAPFVPKLLSITDTSYFPVEELQDIPNDPISADVSEQELERQRDLAFVGYTFKRFDYLTRKNVL